MRYEVFNPDSGASLGIYEADSEAGAVLACVKDAGYDSAEDMERRLGTRGRELQAWAVTED